MEPQHSKLITASAWRILKPLGLVQKGWSRTWLDDRGWTVTMVEFQPSSWSRGSYLNVGNMWLWVEKDYLSFDDGYRVESFVSYRDDDQFQLAADQLVQQAADEVRRRRLLFPDVSAVARYHLNQSDLQCWNLLHAGVACGLSGRAADATRLLHQIAQYNATFDWEKKMVALGSAYQPIVKNRDQFRAMIGDVVQNARKRLKLCDMSAIDFE